MSRDELIQILLARLDRFEEKIDTMSERISALEVKEEIRKADRLWVSRHIKIVSGIISSLVSVAAYVIPKLFN